VVLLLTILFGRIYCSTICPLGTFQDIIGFVSRRLRKKKVYRVTPPQNLLRYSLLGATVIALVLGSGFLLNLLDPFSNFGRFCTNLFRPVLLTANNAGAWLTETFGWYWLYRVEIKNIGLATVVIPVLMLGLVCWLAFTRGRLYCNTVCPVGGLLSLVSRYSVFQIAIDEGDCKGCGLCEKACKSECIDRKQKTVDFDRCVGCFDCFEVCPRDGMMFRTPWNRNAPAAKPAPSVRRPVVKAKEAVEPPANERRRQIIFGPLIALAAWQGLPQVQGEKKPIVSTKASTVPEQKTSPVSPPGSRSIEHFTSNCTACHLCVSACPAKVLAPAFLQYGVLGILQPTMEYRSGYCNFDCVICSEVCPSGAILPIGLEEKKLAQLGTAKFVKDNCIVNTEHTDCGACSEHCPTKAVNMVPFKDKLVIPEVKEEYCVGCGACEHACPTKPYKAIYVDGNPVHKVAKKNEAKQIEQKVNYKEDFPF
jgi:polyferredoxin